MGSDIQKTIGFNELLKEIDRYKLGKLIGERIELIIYPGKDDERIISFGKRDGFARDRTTYVFENGEYFDNELLPELIAKYTEFDTLKGWIITTPEMDKGTIKGETETKSGNLLYLNTYNQELFLGLCPKSDRMELLRKQTNRDEIWNIILEYVRDKKKTKDYFKNMGFSDEELAMLESYAINEAENQEEFISRNTKSAKESNELTINDSLVKIYTIKPYDILLKKLNSSNTNKREFERLVRTERNARTRIDLSNKLIQERIEFAELVLGTTKYFDEFDAVFASSRSREIADAKKNIIQKILENTANVTEQEICNELLGFIERECVKIDRNYNYANNSLGFKSYDEIPLDDYEGMEDAFDFICGAMIPGERYEVVVDNSKEKAIVRIDLLNGPDRSDIYEFEFTNKDALTSNLKRILDRIYDDDQKFSKTIVYNPEGKQISTPNILINTRHDNDFLFVGDGAKKYDGLDGVDEESLNDFMMQAEKYDGPLKEQKKDNVVSLADQRVTDVDYLYEIVKQAEEKDEPFYVTELRENYLLSKNCENTGTPSPSCVKIAFAKDYKDEAEIIISNRSESGEIPIRHETYSLGELNAILPMLREEFVRDYPIDYNVLYGVDGTDDYCLLIADTQGNIFSIINADEEFAKENQRIILDLVKEKQEESERRESIKLAV